jgi:hypothetical protein
MALKDRIARMVPFEKFMYKRTQTFVRKAVVAGAAAGDFTSITGLKKGDKLISVIYRLTAAGNLVDFTSEFGGDSTVVAGKRGVGSVITVDGQINNTGGTTSASGQLEVMWESYGLQ